MFASRYTDLVMATKILVVDDDAGIVENVRAYLREASFDVVTARDGAAALVEFRRSKPDLVILDVMMPGMDGFEVLRTLRRESNVPVILVTARVEETDRLIGLELQADDYVTKPFSPRELVARVKAVLRRAQGEPVRSDIIEERDIVLNRQAHTVTVRGGFLELTPTEFALLETLMQNVGLVLTRLQLIEKALGYSYEGYDRTVDAHVKNLRRKLRPVQGKPEYVVTVYGIGYRFEKDNVKE